MNGDDCKSEDWVKLRVKIAGKAFLKIKVQVQVRVKGKLCVNVKLVGV